MSKKQQAADEAAADAYGVKQVEASYAAEEEPARFSTGGATAEEIAAWRAAHCLPDNEGSDED